MVRVPRENSFLPVSFATLVAIAHIMTQKFVMGIPIYRQEQELNRRGIQLSRQTMYVRMYDELKCKKGDTPPRSAFYCVAKPARTLRDTLPRMVMTTCSCRSI